MPGIYSNMVTKRLTVANPTGLHLRPAGVLAKEAAAYPCEIYIRRKEETVNAKSVLKLMKAGIKCGDRIELCCDGREEECAAKTLARLIESERDF